MNEGLRNKLSEVIGANNISYILNDNTDFSVTGYKVMQNQSSSGLLKCAKIMYNGKIKLVYIVEGNKPLSYVATRLDVNALNAVIFNLIQRAMDIKANGFFKAENLELDFNKIFVDTSDYAVHLIYFPLSGGSTGKISGFENEFRIALINLFNSFPVFSAPQFQRLCSDLANGSLPLEVIFKKLQNNINGNNFNQKIYEPAINQPDYLAQRVTPVSHAYANAPPIQGGFNAVFGGHSQFAGYQNQIVQTPQLQSFAQPTMTISAINSPVQVTLVINEPEYLIGKNPNAVNGAITHNPAISRVHCKVSFSAGRYYLTDMGSANGTYVNQQRLEKQQTVEIRNGDYIALANSNFIVSF